MAGQYIGTQTTKTFSYLFVGATRALESAENEEEGQFYELMNCLILQAFTVEAYLNHLIDGPDEHEMELSFKKARPSVWEKYEAIATALGMDKPKLVDAYPQVAATLEFRNALAHGRTESISVNEILDSDEAPHRASNDQLPDWMNFCDVENARNGLAKVRELVETLHDKAGLGKHPLSTLGGGLFSFKRLD
ncbi:hypothetical protein [Pseudomonas koreensis]|uniref:hypothetical protein n=1 Tax=Pseudomonas koreensis TaxID=198620 RepID=UPI001B325453|nr:hypothetical protein [Pseudomonas koreensis]MBP4001509.1 hypothetical protein [Pseudomonas koreensis]